MSSHSPESGSRYCMLQDSGTETPVPAPGSVSLQNMISVPLIRTGSSQVYCNHRVAGSSPLQVPQSSSWDPPVLRPSPSLTALTSFHPAVKEALGVALGPTFRRLESLSVTVKCTSLLVWAAPSSAVSRRV